MLPKRNPPRACRARPGPYPRTRPCKVVLQPLLQDYLGELLARTAYPLPPGSPAPAEEEPPTPPSPPTPPQASESSAEDLLLLLTEDEESEEEEEEEKEDPPQPEVSRRLAKAREREGQAVLARKYLREVKEQHELACGNVALAREAFRQTGLAFKAAQEMLSKRKEELGPLMRELSFAEESASKLAKKAKKAWRKVGEEA